MGRQQRMDLIREIERQTDSKVLVYITGDRQGLESRIALDTIPYIYKHLKKIGDVPKINLFIYTTGGITMAGYGIVNLIREYCDKYGIIIPFKCLSTGTLMALGADSIIMSKMGQLGPVDPSITHPLGPTIPHPQNPALKMNLPVNVEDVVSFFNLARKEAKTDSEEELTKILTVMAGGLHPIVLGAVNRSRNQIRFLAKTLLRQHTDDEGRIDSIVRTLVEERFSHDYLVGRREAKNDLRLKINDVQSDLMANIMNLYDEYNQMLSLEIPYNIETELGDRSNALLTLHKSIIESENLTHTYSTHVKVKRVHLKDSQTGIHEIRHQSMQLKDEWMQNDDI